MNVVNEMGVIVVFSENCAQYGYEILFIGASFPDAIISRYGVEYKAEFEYKASNFIYHGHDERNCDIIVCWENDIGDFVIPIIELSDPEWGHLDIFVPSEHEKEISYLSRRVQSLERKINSQNARPQRERVKKHDVSDDEIKDMLTENYSFNRIFGVIGGNRNYQLQRIRRIADQNDIE